MNRRIWLLLSTAFLAALVIIGMANAASASLPAGPLSAAPGAVSGGVSNQNGLQNDPYVVNFNCADIQAKHIDLQTNLRAAAIMQKCGSADKNTKPSTNASTLGISTINQLLNPLNYGGLDVNVHPPTSPGIQSESFSWQHGTHVVVAYNDLSTCTGGGSVSIDGGVTFTVLTNAFCSGHGSNFGDPAVVYDASSNKWIVMFLASGCGGQGIGTWVSADDGLTFTTGPCAANVSSGNGDRNSSWVDNNPASPYYGYVYASYNDFGVGGGALRVVRSTDGGGTWQTPVTVFGSFRRDVQLSGDTASSGDVYLASMDEGGGGSSNRTNYVYRSTDGGATWTGVATDAPFAPPGAALCSGNTYFYTVTPQIRHMGWGQPAGGPNNTVHLVYAQHGTGADEGDIYYVRSSDNGATWSTPLKLNQDSTLRAQWMPSIGVTAGGAVFVKWYDRRNTSNNDYEIYGRASLDNGLTWQADGAVSDAVIPQPIVQTANCYMGDYDYWSAERKQRPGFMDR